MNPSTEGKRFELDRSKFDELIVYVAAQERTDPCFGDTMLNKVLYFADVLAYRRTGRPITGAAYQRLDNGPAPRALLPARKRLCQARAISHTPSRSLSRAKIEALRPADLALFTDGEIAIVDEVIEICRGMTAGDLSELSHRWSAGWNLVGDRETIPYQTALIATEGPSDAALARARAAVGQRIL